jgi:hypothetical protein
MLSFLVFRSSLSSMTRPIAIPTTSVFKVSFESPLTSETGLLKNVSQRLLNAILASVWRVPFDALCCHNFYLSLFRISPSSHSENCNVSAPGRMLLIPLVTEKLVCKKRAGRDEQPVCPL